MQTQLHAAQVSTLRALRRSQSARFSDLMRLSGLESDVFKFHLKKLVKALLVQRTSAGRYCLTQQGKEFANNLDESQRKVQRQPKLSVLLVIESQNKDGETFYLFHQRKRNPYFGFWGLPSGPIQWGETAEQTARRELYKQTGLQADFAVHAFYRQFDQQAESGELLEDKLFIVVRATLVAGDLADEWSGGVSRWMTLSELKQQPRYFELTEATIKLRAGQFLTQKNLVLSHEY